MTPERIAELQALCEKATPGPWIWADDQMWFYADYQKRGDLEQNSDGSWKFVSIIETEDGHYGPKENDRDFIAAARTALPELLAELSRLTRERDEAFNAGVEAAANVSIGSVARLPRITNTHKIAEICQFDPLQGWITKEDVIRYGSEITDGIRALKKPSTDEAAGKSGE